jgi:hypothetical protein
MAIYGSDVPFTAPGRRHGHINKNKDTLACDRVIHLPFDLAIVYSAVQNFRIDLAKGIHPNIRVWENVKYAYLEEALELLQEQGCNHYPGDNDEPWIQARTISHVPMPSPRAMKLAEIFQVLFDRDNVNLLKSEHFPNPREVNTNGKIEQLQLKINAHFLFN